LKQFRAAGDPNLAIYQAVIALSCCYSNVNDMQFFDAAEAVVTFQGSSMVNEILGTFLNVPPKWRPGPVMVGSDGKMVPSQLPRVRALEPRMVFSFTAQMDLTAAGTLYTFRDLPPAAPRKPRASR
jgi:hypothetical protein